MKDACIATVLLVLPCFGAGCAGPALVGPSVPLPIASPTGANPILPSFQLGPLVSNLPQWAPTPIPRCDPAFIERCL